MRYKALWHFAGETIMPNSTLTRRLFLSGLTGTASFCLLTPKALAASETLQNAKMRGALNAVEAGLLPGAFDAQKIGRAHV